MNTAIGVTYTIVALVVWRMVAGHIAWTIANRYRQRKPDSSDWFASVVLGALTGILWPLALAALVVCGLGLMVFKVIPPAGAERKALRDKLKS